MSSGAAVVVGGTSGIGLGLAEALAARGRDVVITGRDETRAAAIATGLSGAALGLGLDLAEPAAIAERLAGVGTVDRLVLAAIERDRNTVREFDVEGAIRLATLKLVGYTEVVHALADRLAADASILVFGGLALERPYPGSTMVTAVNGAVTGLVRTLALELAPIRVNGIHPGIVGDTPEWADKPAALGDVTARTPLGRTVTTAEVVDASIFLLDNGGVNGVNLAVDGGWLLR
jgi:NAD(P)-dependent dehydrogenase (short-subunit alcohol dehydrogenase family)